MVRVNRYIILALGLIALRCASKSDHPDVEKARAVHREASMLANQLKVQVLSDSLHPRDSVQGWINELTIWEQNMIEVPGDHEDHHTHDHSHHHQPAPDLTPEQILHVQQELLAQLKAIDKRINHQPLPNQ